MTKYPLGPVGGLETFQIAAPMTISISEAIAFLLKRTNFEQKSSDSYRYSDLKLERMRHLLDTLGNPEKTPAIHIAGTKGKGSTAQMVASLLRESGYRTGLFTSPHLEHFAERIRIQGEMIPDDLITEHVEQLIKAERKLKEIDPSWEPTFFELVTALAWLCFQHQNVEIAVMEVGLGGRLDSTNICHPVVTAITSIGMDHTRLLGNSIPRIAAEKAGILKPGIPVISGCRRSEAIDVIRHRAQTLECQLWELNRDLKITIHDQTLGRTVCTVETPRRSFEHLTLPVWGKHQSDNLAIALGILDALPQSYPAVEERLIRKSLNQLTLPGRQELLSTEPPILLDVAHNEDSTKALIESLREFPIPVDQRILIFGSAKDKDYRAQLQALEPHFRRIILTSATSSERSCYPEKMLPDQTGSLAKYSIAKTPAIALEQAHQFAENQGGIVISGSFYLAGEIRPLLIQQKTQPRNTATA